MSPSPSRAVPFFIAVGLAALGQTCLALWPTFLGLCVGILGYGVALWILSRSVPVSTPAAALAPRWEALAFLLILGLAFFFRIYRIDVLPAGMHSDQGLTGLCALRILHEGWRPFGEVFDYEVPEVSLFYQLAGWFGVVGSSYFTFHLFFILLSLASFPFIYWTFRQWAGPRVALLSLFTLAVMRWSWTMTRNGYPSTQVTFYLFGALAFWTYGLRNGKRWAFYVSALFVGAGFYTYQAFKIVPFLMVLYAIHEYLPLPRRERAGVRVGSSSNSPLTLPSPARGEGFGKNKNHIYMKYFLLVLILCAPLLAVMADKKQLGFREKALFLGTAVVEQKSLKPLWDVWTGTALMFNRTGDVNPRHNIPGHRMLDDVTGVMFVLGLALAWWKRRDLEAFYPLVGLGVMLLTNLLTTDPAHANRLFSVTPFVAFFAGTTLELVFQQTWALFRKPNIPRLVLANALALMTAQNSYAYFVEQARDPACQVTFGFEQNDVGRYLEKIGSTDNGSENFFVDPIFYGNHTVAFLTYPFKNRTFPFVPKEWVEKKEPTDRTTMVFLDKKKLGWGSFLQALFPRTHGDQERDELGRAFCFFKAIVRDDLKDSKPWDKGLKGSYSSGLDQGPSIVQQDPVLNFTSKFDFPFTQGSPFRIRWTGELEIANGGKYQFQTLASDPTRLWLDGKEVKLDAPLSLKKGTHSIRLELAKDSGNDLALTFIWKKPGDEKWEVVPATAFGKAPLKASDR